jgi:hypothetical protein
VNTYFKGTTPRHESDALRQIRAQLEIESGDSLELARNIEDNPICSITLDKSVPCIAVVWRRYATSTQLRFIHEVILELLKKHHVSKVLGDDTNLPTIHRDDQAWIAHNWMPRAVAAGLKVACNKAPIAFFGRMAVSSVQSIAPEGLLIRSFEDIADAQRWLQNFNLV